mmetsp:Transcript_3066/g.3820  ORF Transcript_3066/g.3820 Transcript_3066/m.3820 type:complete len:117 (+) Transcript_3066:316-666(+)
MLMWSYMNQATAVKQQQQQQQQQDHELDDSDFLSHWLIWHMFVYYCLEKPLLFLVLLWLVQLEAIVQAPWQNLTMFLMMLSPRIPYIAVSSLIECLICNNDYFGCCCNMEYRSLPP